MIYPDLAGWLAAHLPEVADDLNDAATEDDLKALGEHLGLALPNDYCDLYRWHDGQKQDAAAGLFYGMGFMPISKVRQAFDEWSALIEQEGPEGLAGLSSYSTSALPGRVKTQYANRAWIPFAHDWSGNYLGIDLDPDVAGTAGQVINFGRDEDTKFVLAPNLNAFIQWFASQLQSGNFSIADEDDGGRSFNTSVPPTGHFLDAVKKLFKTP